MNEVSQPDCFQFEADFVDSLRCIPMQVRYKLDTCGVKLKLQHWHQFTFDERRSLLELACTTPETIATYRHQVQLLVKQYTGELPRELAIDPKPAWHNIHAIPETVRAKAGQVGLSLTVDQWVQLNSLQRFALLKLSRSGHENNNFLPAAQEFKLC